MSRAGLFKLVQSLEARFQTVGWQVCNANLRRVLSTVAVGVDGSGIYQELSVLT